MDFKGIAGTYPITVVGDSGETILGQANYVIDVDRAGVTFVDGGTDWAAK